MYVEALQKIKGEANQLKLQPDHQQLKNQLKYRNVIMKTYTIKTPKNAAYVYLKTQIQHSHKSHLP